MITNIISYRKSLFCDFKYIFVFPFKSVDEGTWLLKYMY
jgi:hypothetical protein